MSNILNKPMILALLAFVFAELVTLIGLAGPVESFLAYAPGGQAGHC